MEPRPILRTGVRIWRSRFTNELRIGTRRRNIPLRNQYQDIPTESLIRLFDGRRTPNEIADFTGVSRSELDLLITMLIKGRFVENSELSIQARRNLANRDRARLSRPADGEAIDSISLKEIRLGIERDSMAFNEDSKQGPSDLSERIAYRAQFKILIFNSNRIAVCLAGALKSAGFEAIRIIDRAPRGHRSRLIQGEDLLGAFFRNSEILHLKEPLLNELLEVNDGDGSKIGDPNLIISVGAPPFDTQQRWLSEGTPHLMIDYENSAEVRIGPLVIPGSAPCLTCVEATELELGLALPDRELIKSVEIPSGLALHIAGLVTMIVSQFADTGESPMIGQSLDIAVYRFLEPEYRNWSLHPSCGCSN